MPVILINDFSGGLDVTSPEENLGPNQLYNINNFLHERGGLRSIEGRNTLTTTGTAAVSAIVGTASVMSMKRFYKTNHPVQQTATTNHAGWTLAKSSTALWLDTAEVNTAGSGVSRKADFRPIIDRPTSRGVEERFCAMNGRLYFTNQNDENWMWDGRFYKVGQAKISGTTMLGSGTNWLTAVNTYGSVKIGDKTYIKNGANWSLTAGIVAKSIHSGTHIELNSAGPSVSSFSNYIISGAHDARVIGPTTAPALAATAGTSLATGTYKYKFTYENNDLGIESDPSPAATIAVTGVNRRVVVGNGTNWPQYPSAFNWQYSTDTVNVYRTRINGTSSYFFADDVTRGTTGNFGTFTDTLPDASLTTAVAAPSDHTAMPDDIKYFIEFNGRLYGWGSKGNPEKLYFSTLGSPDYFPAYEFGIDDPSDATLGGYVVLSEPGDPIVAAIVEGGTYGSSGKAGSNLLVFTNTRAYRWYGIDWNDFARAEALGIGCIAPKSLVNHGGMIIWLSHQGIVALPSGANAVQNIGLPIRASIPDNITEPLMTYGAKCVGSVWRDWYILAWPGDSYTYNTFVDMLHIPTMTWTSLNESPSVNYINDLSVWDGTGDNGELYYADETNSYIWQMFVKSGSNTYFAPSSSTGVSARFGKFLTLARSEEEIDWVKTIKRVSTCWARPASAQNVTLKIETNGAWPNVQSSPTFSKTVSVSSTDAGSTARRRAYAEWYPNVSGRSFALEFNGIFTAQMQIIWIKVEYELEDKSPGRTVG